MTTQKRKIPEMSPSSAAVAVEEAPAPKAENVETSNGDISVDEHSPVVAADPEVTESTPPATAPDTKADEPAEDAPQEEPPSGTGEPDAPTATTTTVETEDRSAQVAESAAQASLTALTALTGRISALEEAFARQQQAIADVRASVTDDIAGSIALEVERVTTDELVDAKRNLSLAAHSMAHLALGITEAADNVTGELGPDSITALLHSFRAEVDNVLLQLGYAPLDTRVGERFDPNRHRSLRRIPTDDMSLDRLIARVIRDGYRSENTKRILVYSDVEVHRHQS